MRIQNLSADEALAAMQSRQGGLTSEEAQRRLREYGLNSIPKRKRISPALLFLSELKHFFAVILWVASVFCFIASFVYSDRAMMTLGYAVAGVVIVNAFFSFWQSWKAERAIDALEKLLPKSCSVFRDGCWRVVPVENLVPGDIVELHEGDDAGADVRLIAARGLRVDTANITGESLPSFRNPDPDLSEDMLWAKNLVLTGMRVVSGRGMGVVFATGLRTEFGKIAQLTMSETPKVSHL